jgi:hypothetical protein
VYCLKHAQKYAGKANHLSFAVERLVTVHWAQQDEKQRLKNNTEDFRPELGRYMSCRFSKKV